ncbi:hypothetical protein AVEN_117577-1 [Araneus ventricosus]|uniref:Uncharacterized protein n=1 Tax=Araneus ventricosus TaxID=182803 RepID=A0A4Y2MXE3_ARAVE|nr:hypothetical protein AVEN_117577-1 [Araneus ventricosus]
MLPRLLSRFLEIPMDLFMYLLVKFEMFFWKYFSGTLVIAIMKIIRNKILKLTTNLPIKEHPTKLPESRWKEF